tara:strand:+ start:836 stop:1141 length:306 start_codon:yes stop_codon:yes gene_type:complete
MERVLAFNVLYATADYTPVSSAGWVLLLVAPYKVLRIATYVALSILAVATILPVPVDDVAIILPLAVAFSAKWIFPTPPSDSDEETASDGPTTNETTPKDT